jgi:toxin ParE1/3/4
MKVRFTRPAQRDLLRIHDRVSQDNPDAASRIVARITELAWALKDNPRQGRETDEPNALLFLVPRLHYFIFYSIVDDEIHINHIRHTSRKRPRGWVVS